MNVSISGQFSDHRCTSHDGKKMLIQDMQILQDDPLPHFFVSVFYFEKSMCNVMFLFSQVQGCAYSAMLSKGQL